MFYRVVLGLLALALLTSCAGMALPETGRIASVDDDLPIADRQALAEFQFETSGNIGVAGEAAVPAPIEDVPIADRQALAEFQFETSGNIGVAGEPAVPLEEISEQQHYMDFLMTLEGTIPSPPGPFQPPTAPVPVEDIEQYIMEERTPIDDLLDERALRTVPAPVEDEYQLLPDELWLIEERPQTPLESAAVPAPNELENLMLPYELWRIEERSLGPRESAAVPAPVEDEYQLLPDELWLIEERPQTPLDAAAVPAPVEAEDLLRLYELWRMEEQSFRPTDVEGMRPVLPTEGTWGPNYEDEPTFTPEKRFSEVTETSTQYREFLTTGAWAPAQK